LGVQRHTTTLDHSVKSNALRLFSFDDHLGVGFKMESLGIQDRLVDSNGQVFARRVHELRVKEHENLRLIQSLNELFVLDAMMSVSCSITTRAHLTGKVTF
jgi:hypothetical protein